MLDIPITGNFKAQPVPLRSGRHRVADDRADRDVARHNNLQPTIELTMGIEGRDLGHVADDISRLLEEFGSTTEVQEQEAPGRHVREDREEAARAATWAPYEPGLQGFASGP